MTTRGNDRLRALRTATQSPKRPGASMSRAELAEAVNAHVWETSGQRVSLDAEAVGRYERGVIQWPGGLYRDALGAILGARTDEALGFRPTPRGRAARPRSARRDVDDLARPDAEEMEPGAVDLASGLGPVLEALAAADAAAGPLLVLASAQAQSELLATLTRATTAAARRAALPVTARFAEFTGWLHQDSGDVVQASWWTDRALEHALESGVVRYDGLPSSRSGQAVMGWGSGDGTAAGRPSAEPVADLVGELRDHGLGLLAALQLAREE